MAIKIISALEKYDRETKENLVLDMIQNVYKEKNYKLSEYVELILNDWIPVWIQEREEDSMVIGQLEKDLRMFV